MPNWAGGAMGAATGAKLGSFIPGIGTGIGAGIGGLIGLFGGKKKPKSTTGPTTDPNYAFRERAIAPVRSAYGGAMQNINRRAALQGGYMPGYGVLQSRLAREGGQALSDAALQGEREASEFELRKRQVPSDYQRKLASIGGTMDIIGRGAGAVGSFFR
jgi:hypothetical protein